MESVRHHAGGCGSQCVPEGCERFLGYGGERGRRCGTVEDSGIPGGID